MGNLQQIWKELGERVMKLSYTGNCRKFAKHILLILVLTLHERKLDEGLGNINLENENFTNASYIPNCNGRE